MLPAASLVPPGWWSPTHQPETKGKRGGAPEGAPGSGCVPLIKQHHASADRTAPTPGSSETPQTRTAPKHTGSPAAVHAQTCVSKVPSSSSRLRARDLASSCRPSSAFFSRSTPTSSALTWSLKPRPPVGDNVWWRRRCVCVCVSRRRAQLRVGRGTGEECGFSPTRTGRAAAEKKGPHSVCADCLAVFAAHSAVC